MSSDNYRRRGQRRWQRMFHNWGMRVRRESSVHKEVIYSAKNTVDLSDEEIEECSELFSLFYGKYSAESKVRPGGQVRMGPRYYKEHYLEKRYISAGHFDTRLPALDEHAKEICIVARKR